MLQKLRFSILLSIIVIFCFLFQSCSVSYFKSVESTVPPKLQFPSNVKTIRILDRSIPDNVIERTVSAIVSGTSIGDPLNSAKQNLFLQLDKGIAIPISKNTRKYRHADIEKPAPLIDQVTLKERVGESDALLSLDFFNWNSNRTYKNIEKHQLDDNGNDYVLNALEGRQFSELKLLWRLYNAQSGKVIMEYPQNKKSENIVQALDETGVNQKLDQILTINPDAFAKELGDDFIRSTKSTSTYGTWKYYTSGNKVLKSSAQNIKKKQWLKAEAKLKIALVSEKETKLKERILFNLATVSFQLGKQGDAIKFATQGYNLKKNKEFQELIKKINQS